MLPVAIATEHKDIWPKKGVRAVASNFLEERVEELRQTRELNLGSCTLKQETLHYIAS